MLKTRIGLLQVKSFPDSKSYRQPCYNTYRHTYKQRNHGCAFFLPYKLGKEHQ
jgi:hypothetical protein